MEVLPFPAQISIAFFWVLDAEKILALQKLTVY